VRAILKGASYKLVHCDNAKRTEKRHASDLSPYPAKLIPFEPVDGADTRYGQLYKPISVQPFKEAGIKGFVPPEPFKLATNLAITNRCAASIGQAYPSSTMSLHHSPGPATRNSHPWGLDCQASCSNNGPASGGPYPHYSYDSSHPPPYSSHH
jgi:hypothetical protein